MVGLSIFVLVLRAKAVALFREARRILGDIDEVPVVALVMVFPDLVGPACHGGKTVIAEQQLNIRFGDRRQVGSSEISDDGMAFRSPGPQMSGSKTCQKEHGDDLFHETSDCGCRFPLRAIWINKEFPDDCSVQGRPAQS